MSDALTLKNATVAHNRILRDQVEKNNLELEKIKLAHQKRVSDLKNQHALQVTDLKYQQENQVMDQTRKNEVILNKLHDNVTKTKEVTNKEIQNLKTYLQGRKDTMRSQFEKDFQNNAEKNELRLEDANHIANQEIKRLKYRMDLKKRLINNTARTEQKVSEEIHKNKQALQKDQYLREKHNNEDKYFKQLSNQRKQHIQQIAQKERTHQKNIDKRQNIYNQEMKRIQKDAINKKQIKQAHFETEYNKLNKKQEFLLQNILGRKEKLIQNLKKDLWNEYRLGVKKSDDPFYDFGKLTINVNDIPNGYKISIPMAKHEASHVDMKAEERTLSFTMERRHEFKNDETDGSTNSMKKFETYVSKVPVEDIINPKTIQKGYQDGNVIFTIAKK